MIVYDSVVTVYERKVYKELKAFYFDFVSGFKTKDTVSRFKEFEEFFYLVRNRIEPGVKYRNVNNLGVVVLYMFLKINCKLVPLPKLLQYYQLPYNDFVTGLKKVLSYYPEYQTRDKKNIVEAFVRCILTNFHFRENVLQNASIVLNRFYPYLQQTKEEVSAAVISELTLIASGVTTVITKEVCEQAGIQQSTLVRVVGREIVPRLKIPNYSTFAKSSQLIKKKVEQSCKLLKVNVSEVTIVKRSEAVKTLPRLAADIVEMRRNKTSLGRIARECGLTVYKVRRILERKLPYYQDYSPFSLEE